MSDLVQQLIDGAVSVRSPAELDALPANTITVLLHELNDEAASALQRLTQLRSLVHSGNSSITDQGVEALAKISTLEVLDLEWSAAISDQALISLRRLSKLRWIDLSFCSSLSEDAIVTFSSGLPECEVER